jgi:hypothetical protein
MDIWLIHPTDKAASFIIRYGAPPRKRSSMELAGRRGEARARLQLAGKGAG